MKEPKKPSPSAAAPATGIDFAELERVLHLMQEHGLEEFEYAVGDLRMHLRKPFSAAGAGKRAVAMPAEQYAAPAPQASVSPAPIAAPVAPSAAPAVAEAPGEELHVIKSPIVGTFYSSPNPDAPPFAKVGDAVQQGQTICIVEAMKLMNEIEADIGGEIVRVLIENGQPVEYGEPLFELRPSKKKK